MQALSRSARRIGLLAGLLVVFFGLLSYQVNRARTLASARAVVFTVSSPVQRLLAAVTSGIGGGISGWSDLVGAAERAEALEREVAELRHELRSLRRAETENRRLRELLDLRAALDETGIGARVVGRDLAHRYETVILDRGSTDGVATDAPVLAPDGALVGRIVQVAPWTSVVQLVTDPLSGVGARLARSRATGLAAGNDGPMLELRYVDTDVGVTESERIVTSGEDGIYPPGIEIGTVESFTVGSPVPGMPRIPLAREETALFWEIRVDPSIDVLRLETVLVLPRRAVGTETDIDDTDPADDDDTDPADDNEADAEEARRDASSAASPS